MPIILALMIFYINKQILSQSSTAQRQLSALCRRFRRSFSPASALIKGYNRTAFFFGSLFNKQSRGLQGFADLRASSSSMPCFFR